MSNRFAFRKILHPSHGKGMFSLCITFYFLFGIKQGQILLTPNVIPRFLCNIRELGTIHVSCWNEFQSCKHLMNCTLWMYISSILQAEIGILHSLYVRYLSIDTIKLTAANVYADFLNCRPARVVSNNSSSRNMKWGTNLPICSPMCSYCLFILEYNQFFPQIYHRKLQCVSSMRLCFQ